MRAVFDTNILISAMLWRGAPYRCLLAIQAGLAELVLSPPILDELRWVLNKKFSYTEKETKDAVKFVQDAATLVKIPGSLRAVPDDPEDDKFIETAQVAGAKYIVSGDRHLLKMGLYGGIEIINARAFLEKLTAPKE